MTPLLAAGAASVAGELVSRVASSIVSRGAHAQSLASAGGRVFDQVLHRASHSVQDQARVDESRAALVRVPEVARALSQQPAGSVTSFEVRADGSLALGTARGPVEVALSVESQAVVRQIFQGISQGGDSLLTPSLGAAAGFAPATSAVMGGAAVSRVPSVVIAAAGLR